MNAAEATKRIRFTWSGLSNQFLIGIGNAKDQAFIEKRDATSEFFAMIMRHLDNGKYSQIFVAQDGEEWELIVRPKQEKTT